MLKKIHTTSIALMAMMLILLVQNSDAQNVGINTTGAAPNSSAMLDVNASNKGVLIPQVSLASLTDAVTITTPASSLIVYNTNAGLTGGVGYYYNSGTSASPAWVKVLTSGSTLGQSSATFYTNNAVTLNNAGVTFTYAAGFPVTVTIPANCTVLLTADIGVATNNVASATGYSIVDISVFVDAAIPADGLYQRLTPSNNGGLGGQTQIASFSEAFSSLSAGNHTFGIAGINTGSGGSATAATMGGNSTSVLEGELTITIIKN